MKQLLPLYHPSEDRYFFSSVDGCASFASSFQLLDSSPCAGGGQRRPSLESMYSSITPELLSVSSVGTTSPSTPLHGSSFDSGCFESSRNRAPQMKIQDYWGMQPNQYTEHDFGYSPAVTKSQNGSTCFHPYSLDIDHASRYYLSSYHGLANDTISPALSRPMFTDTIPPSMTNNVHWPPVSVAHTPPRTIDPSAFAPLVLSSPTARAEPFTPSRQLHRSPAILSNSPMSCYSPGIVSSQHETDESAFFGLGGLSQDPADLAHDRIAGIETERRLQSRLVRRRYNHKGSGSGPIGKRKPLGNKSGIEYDSIVLQNSFACSYPECIDKNTGKQKKFKRQEHKKRHEKTVHEKETHVSHVCWVPQCERSFSRTDNLKSHLRNTHGKRSANARNRYVATLDPNNAEYYSPDWVGDLTPEGLPIGIATMRPRM